MSAGFWGDRTYSDGSRVPLRAERCVSKPVPETQGTHACRQHREHTTNVTTATHRCICGIRWGADGKVQQ